MSVYNLHGLQGLPSEPSKSLTVHGGLLQPNHQWVRYYEVDMQHQLRVCPKNPPFGCWIIGGFAWGQREWYPDEFEPHGFVLQPLPKPFPHPAAPLTAKTAVMKAPTPAAKPVSKAVPKAAAKKVPIAVAPVRAPLVIAPPPVSSTTAPSVVLPADDTALVPSAAPSRHVGSVVGIGLVIATVLSLLRKYPQAVKR